MAEDWLRRRNNSPLLGPTRSQKMRPLGPDGGVPTLAKPKAAKPLRPLAPDGGVPTLTKPKTPTRTAKTLARKAPTKKSPMFSTSEAAEMERLGNVAKGTKTANSQLNANFAGTVAKNRVKTTGKTATKETTKPAAKKTNRGYDSYKKLMGD